MSGYYGDVTWGTTIIIPFNTYNSSGESVTYTGGTIAIYAITPADSNALVKLGDLTGAQVNIEKDNAGIVGTHSVRITPAENVDMDMVTGKDYAVYLEGATIDGKTVNTILGSFSIENRYMRGTNNAALASVLGSAVNATKYVGNFKLGNMVNLSFVTDYQITDEGNGIRVYRVGGSTAIVPSGATLESNYGNESYMHQVQINLTSVYEDKEDYYVVLSGATVNGIVTTCIIGSFSINNRYVKPTQRYAP